MDPFTLKEEAGRPREGGTPQAPPPPSARRQPSVPTSVIVARR